MKKAYTQPVLSLILVIVLSCFNSLAQSPALISYQAIIRDGGGVPIIETDKTMKFSILQGSATGTTAYWEIQTVHTNSFGLVNIKIGSVRPGIETIDWSAGPYYLKVEVDAVEMGTTQIVSVPFALYAQKTVETDPVFNGSAAKNITTTDKTHWNTAWGWGDHSIMGYIQGETDPLFDASTAKTITLTDKTNWNSAYGWGNHASIGYLTSQISHTDVVVDGDFASNGILKRTAPGIYGIVTDNSANWNTAYGWGDHSAQSYLKTELDPVFNASAAKNITAGDITNWNTVKWTRTNDSLYYTKGNVGVGTKDPKSTLTVAGTTPTDSAIFEVKNNNGITVFAVYNDGVRITIDETAKGATKGGFAIGGFSTVKGVNRDYMKVTGDSIRLYLDNKTPAKGATKGGFAIGGFDVVKGPISRYMNISTDAGASSGYNTFMGYKSGGLGSGGLYNIAIGSYSGYNLNLATSLTGRNNIFIGDSAGLSNSVGYQNVYVGKNSGSKNTSGFSNIYIGYRSGATGTTGQYNVFVGDQTGKLTTGSLNVFIGTWAGQSVTSGQENTLIGTNSGWKLGTGQDNTFLGTHTGTSAVNTNGNTFIGAFAGGDNISGTDNVFLGKWAGRQSLGSHNIFIGNEAGYSVTTGDNQLIIDNDPTNVGTAFIGGDMLNEKLIINADVGIRATPPTGDALYIYGKAENTGGWFVISDARRKTNIRTISNPIEKVLALRGVTFEWTNPDKFNSGSQIGFIAQETLKVLPEVVSTNGDYYSIQYAPVTALLVEAIKELKKENEDLKTKLKTLDDLQAQIDALKAIVLPGGSK